MVKHHLAKVGTVSSNLISRSMEDIRLDEEPLLKSGNTLIVYLGFESLVFRNDNERVVTANFG